MTQYDYRVLPAPTKARNAEGARTAEDRFAATIQAALNEQADTGWEFLRAETLPAVERQGLTGTRTVFQTVLVFRRPATAERVAERAAPPRLLSDQSAVADPAQEPDSLAAPPARADG